MRKMSRKFILIQILVQGLFLISSYGTTRYAGTYSELTTAITNSASSGDIIQITANIVVTAQVTINKSLTIYGNDYTITVPNPGLDEMGRFNSSASTFRVFEINTASTSVVINNLTIKGGNVSSAGGAIYISNTTAKLTLNNCTVSNSRTTGWVGGGGIYNLGVLYLNGCYIRRNAAEYGGGLLNQGASAVTYFESSTMVENRVTSSSGGGGAVENKGGAFMYFNNSTLSNNQSLIVGGAVNNYQSTLYFVNSSATGNVVYGVEQGTSLCRGGSISNNGGYFYSVNSLYAHNYRATSGTSSNPGGFVLDDVVAYSNQNQVFLYYSLHHADLPSGMGGSVSNIQYTGNINGSDNTIFSDGISSKITDNNGNEIGSAIYRPFLYNNQGSVAPTLKSGSFLQQVANRGTRTRYANNNNVNPVVAYYNGSSYVNLKGTSSSGQEVLIDQVGDARPDPPTRGAIEGEVDNLYMVKVLVSSNGTVSGGTFYGDVYPSGTSVTLTAIPNSGYEFTRFDYVLGGSGTASTNNPYTFSVSNDITLQPVYTSLPPSNYSITYLGNGNTGGTAPSDVTFSGSTTIAGAGDLTKTGYTFNGWNTNAYGSGTSYSAGATYSTAANLTLYAKWSQVTTWNWTGATSSTWGSTGNWTKSDQSTPTVPTSSDNVYIPSVANDPVLADNATANCNNLTIASGAKFTVQSTASGTGSLITSGTVTGNLTIERYISGSATLTLNKYHLVSIPLAVSNSSTSELFLDSYLYKYLPETKNWQALGSSTTTILDESIGYMIYYPGTAKTYSFTGATNTGTFTPTVTYPGLGDGSNFALVPNPYPSNIDWNAASGWTKTNIGATIWVYNSSVGNYAIWDGTNTTNGGSRYIAVGQAFFVQTTATSPSLVMNNEVRTHTSATFLKTGNGMVNQLRVKALAGGFSDEVLVGFNNEASNEYNEIEDALKLFGQEDAPQMYTNSDNNLLSINMMGGFSGGLAIPLNFETSYEGEVTLTFSQTEEFNSQVSMYLQDELTGQTINLRNQQVYTFTHSPANPANRFQLVFGGTIGMNEMPVEADQMWISGNTLYINTPEQTGQHALLEVFSSSGDRLMAKSLVLNELTTTHLNQQGFVIVKLTSGREIITTKGILN